MTLVKEQLVAVRWELDRQYLMIAHVERQNDATATHLSLQNEVMFGHVTDRHTAMAERLDELEKRTMAELESLRREQRQLHVALRTAIENLERMNERVAP